MSNVEYSTTTTGETMTDTLVWTVPRFLSLIKDNECTTRELRMEKPEDAAADSSSSRIELKLRFLGRHNDIIEIYYLSPVRLILKLEFKIRHQILSKSYYDEREIDKKVNYINQGDEWQYLSVLYKRDIIRHRQTFLLSDCSLCLIIEFTTFQTKYNPCFINVDERVAETELSQDFGQLLTSGLYSDVTLKSVEGNELKAHKVVLASRSVVLKAHFAHNTIESQTNIIESRFEAEVLREVLAFIYSNKAMRVDEIPEKLLAAADFYQLSRLKSLCGKALSKKLTAENVIGTLELANLYSAENLTQSALEFIKQGQAIQIIGSEEWANLNVVKSVKHMFELYIMADDN